jgi:arylsulfatase B
MTGKYPHHLGMQHFVVPSDEPWALSSTEKIMPQYFKDAGYVTRLIGKWHLGFYQKKYTPTERGFDSHFGYLGPYIDYFDYSLKMFDKNYSRGYDMRNNHDVYNTTTPQYATELFTNEAVQVINNHDQKNPLFLMVNHLAPHAGNEDFPMQAKAEDMARFDHIKNEKRKTLAAMIYQLDKSVGEIVKALRDSNMLKDSVIVFYSDNGGPTVGLHSTAASNYPLRSQKQSAFEGGIRTNAFIYSPFLPKETVRRGLFYVADLLPTLNTISQANFKINGKIDGHDQSMALKYNLISPRNELITIDDVLGYSSYIFYGLKVVNGSSSNGKFDGYLGSNNNSFYDIKNYTSNVLKSRVSESLKSSLSKYAIERLRASIKIQCSNSIFKNPCDLLKSPCLFDLINDPCEENNLADKYPFLFRPLYNRYKSAISDVVQTRRKPADANSDPANFHNTWSWWQQDSQ